MKKSEKSQAAFKVQMIIFVSLTQLIQFLTQLDNRKQTLLAYFHSSPIVQDGSAKVKNQRGEK